MNSDQDMVKRVKETIELEDKLDADQKFKNNLPALTIVLCDKFLSSENMIELWRDRKMVKFFKYVEDQGKNEEARMLMLRQIKAKFGDSDNEIIDLINKAELSKIEDLSEKIITADSKEEIIDFLKH
jgi:hypothetical protein